MSFPKTQSEWRTALDALPSTPEKIPAFFFGHGSPMLIARQVTNSPMTSTMGPGGDLASFLRDLGPALRAKYKPKGIVVFSAHWETIGVRHGKDNLQCTPKEPLADIRSDSDGLRRQKSFTHGLLRV